MENTSKKLIKYLRQQLLSMEFKFTHRTSPQHFTRESLSGRPSMNFQTTSLIVIKMVKKSAKVEIMDFYYDFDETAESPSRQALSDAREKISYLAFKDFADKSFELTLSGEGAREYKGYRLFACDGTSFVVGMLSHLSKYFGESTSVPGKAMCRISGIVDVLNECIIDAVVAPFSTGERVLAMTQIEKLKHVPNALYLFDRGYWKPELVKSIVMNNQKFVMRLPSNVHNTAVKDDDGNIIPLRKHSFTLPGGEVETLLTNLTEDEISNAELEVLYTKRWGIETKYLELKDRLQIDKLSGKTENIVLQDIYATLFISNLVAFTCFDADKLIAEKTKNKNNKYRQKANRSTCISAYRRRLIKICLIESESKRELAIERLCRDISKDVTYIDKSKPTPRNRRQLKQSRLATVKCIL